MTFFRFFIGTLRLHPATDAKRSAMATQTIPLESVAIAGFAPLSTAKDREF
jgi:hypothetical protein